MARQFRIKQLIISASHFTVRRFSFIYTFILLHESSTPTTTRIHCIYIVEKNSAWSEKQNIKNIIIITYFITPSRFTELELFFIASVITDQKKQTNSIIYKRRFYSSIWIDQRIPFWSLWRGTWMGNVEWRSSFFNLWRNWWAK